MSLLFIKRLNDTFEENAEELIREGKNQKEAYQNKIRHEFFIPKEARWSLLSRASENIGQIIDDVCRLIEKENRGSYYVACSNDGYQMPQKQPMVL